ncbi:hypothetical protein C0995_011457 [Termitomyces sp. Mi166|nr:hypothetical protein C0995_011457 [Termitomyces sp. Mi166\
MTASVFSLPLPLILLIHLHILEYPHANSPEYDHNIFHPRVRGLKERTKLLEDICYFLVGRLEGNAKSILPTYPCLVPSDTLAFRTSLSKYLEALRHNAIYPASKHITDAKAKGKSRDRDTEGAKTSGSWWWKDVVVRKSLLEECAGERFERLLLSFSTHVLFKSTASSPHKLKFDLDLENLNALLRSLPQIYVTRLAFSKRARNAWTQSASDLLRREAELVALRERLKTQGGDVSPKHTSVPTPRLVALVDAQYHKLLRASWAGPRGKEALEFLMSATGIERPAISNDASSGSAPDTKSNLAVQGQVQGQGQPQPHPLPLPVAAAHHPAHISKFRKPVFSSASLRPQSTLYDTASTSTVGASVPTLVHVLAEQDKVETRTGRVLRDAVGKVREKRREWEAEREAKMKMKERVRVVEAKVQKDGKTKSKPVVWKKKAPLPVPFKFDLWEPSPVHALNFNTEPTPELISSFGLQDQEREHGLEPRIDEILHTLLPAYPALPDLSAPRVACPHSHSHSESESGAPTNLKNLGTEKKVSKVPSGIRNMVPPVQPARGGVNHVDEEGTKTKRGDGEAGIQNKREKLKPRKSIRVSLAAHAERRPRPSLFAPIKPDDDDKDVHQMIHSMQDVNTSTEIAEADTDVLCALAPDPRTTKNVKRKVKRVLTCSGTRLCAEKEKEMSPGVFREPVDPLPSLVGASESFDGLSGDAGWGDSGLEDQEPGEVQSDEEYEGDAGSMTLRDILLSADVTGFGLLDLDEGGDTEVGMGDGDVSFEWE